MLNVILGISCRKE